MCFSFVRQEPATKDVGGILGRNHPRLDCQKIIAVWEVQDGPGDGHKCGHHDDHQGRASARVV